MVKRLLVVAAAAMVACLAGCASHDTCNERIGLLESKLADATSQYEQLSTDFLAQADAAKLLKDQLKTAQDEAAANASRAAAALAAQKALEAEKAELTAMIQDMAKILKADVVTRDGQEFIRMESEVLFASGSHELTDEAKTGLEALAKALIQRNLHVRIDGHTDGEPLKHARNKYTDLYHLGAMRALAVRAFLEEKGVPAGNMFVAGFGPNVPMAPREDPTAANQEDRRVELLVTMPTAGSSGSPVPRNLK